MSRFSDFLSDLKERGAKFLDRLSRGRRASAHARTILGDAVVDTYNSAQLIRGRAIGSPGARVHDALLGDTDDACEKADGQTWSLSVALANKREHPNCTREFDLLTPGDTRTLDRT